ncbi:MAG: hypothetical protein WA821_02360 [Anaerolineales bacterium]
MTATIFLEDKARDIIRKSLEENGMVNIVIERDWSALNFILKFDVTYTMPNGVRYTNRCKLYTVLFFVDDNIHWRDPL